MLCFIHLDKRKTSAKIQFNPVNKQAFYAKHIVRYILTDIQTTDTMGQNKTTSLCLKHGQHQIQTSKNINGNKLYVHSFEFTYVHLWTLRKQYQVGGWTYDFLTLQVPYSKMQNFHHSVMRRIYVPNTVKIGPGDFHGRKRVNVKSQRRVSWSHDG